MKKPMNSIERHQNTANDIGEAEVRAQLELIAERRQEGTFGFDKDMAMAVAALARALVGFEQERRQQAKAEMRALSQYSTDQLIEHIKAMPDAKREGVIRELTGADNEEPLL